MVALQCKQCIGADNHCAGETLVCESQPAKGTIKNTLTKFEQTTELEILKIIINGFGILMVMMKFLFP